jgi:hypothetical protein
MLGMQHSPVLDTLDDELGLLLEGELELLTPELPELLGPVDELASPDEEVPPLLDAPPELKPLPQPPVRGSACACKPRTKPPAHPLAL